MASANSQFRKVTIFGKLEVTFGQTIQYVLGIVKDTSIGLTRRPDALAGVSLAFPFVTLIQHTAASGMGGGVSSAIARALGAGKRDVADALSVLHW
jgi:Na+-driven multidrug efflux pump